MKNISLLLLLLLPLAAFAQPQLTDNQKLESLAKVWGFLKYYHPAVATGKLDWDAELMQKINEVQQAPDQQALNQLYSNWLDQLGKVSSCRRCIKVIPDSQMRNVSFGWLYDSTIFTPALIQKLDYIRNNRNQGKNYYVQQRYPLFKTQAYFKNEKPFEDLEPFPAEKFRLLGLFRYWNMINYFFPYKYAIGESWDKALADMLPKFRDASSAVPYHLAMLELVTRINDGHAYLSSRYTGHHFGAYYVPFQFKLLDDKAVVTGFYNEELAKADGIAVGDVISQVGGQPVMEVLAPKLKYIPGSNLSFKHSQAYFAVFNGHSDSLEITTEKDGLAHTRQVRRYHFSRFGYKPETTAQPPWRLLSSQVGYIDMGVLAQKEVKAAMQAVWRTKGLVIDLRKYPNPTSHGIAAHLKTENKRYATLTYPDLTYPGVFKPKAAWKTGVRSRKDYYKGKVVLLVNEGTISAGEFASMALQSAPDVTVIGSQTAGADGNIVRVVFPGGVKTQFTGLGVYYPDGRQTQRIGIVPDIEVKPTAEGIRAGEDEVLNRALHFLETGK